MGLTPIPILVLSSLAGIPAQPAPEVPRFVDATSDWGLGPDVVPETVGRLCFADLDDDGWPDAVVNRHRIFMNRPRTDSTEQRRFIELPPQRTGLRPPVRSTATVFVDLDHDRTLDAVIAEHVDATGRSNPANLSRRPNAPRSPSPPATPTSTVASTSTSAIPTRSTVRAMKAIRMICSSPAPRPTRCAAQRCRSIITPSIPRTMRPVARPTAR